MNCIACPENVKLILPGDIIPGVLGSKWCNMKLMRQVLSMYLCKNFHMIIECRKCGIKSCTLTNAVTHHIKCFSKYKIPSYNYYIFLEGFMKYNKLMVSIYDIVDLIPQLLVLDIDYISAFRKSEHIFECFSHRTDYIISSGTHDMLIAIYIIKKQQPSCNMCGMFYETFPSLEVVLRHFEFCCALLRN